MTASVIYGPGTVGIWTTKNGIFDTICSTMRPLLGSLHPGIIKEVYQPYDHACNFINLRALSSEDYQGFLRVAEECVSLCKQFPVILSVDRDAAECVLKSMEEMLAALRTDRRAPRTGQGN